MRELRGLGINVYLNHFDKKSIDKLITSLVFLKVRWIRLEICSQKFIHKQNLSILVDFVKLCKLNKIIVVGLLSDFIPLNTLNVFFPEYKTKAVTERINEYFEFIDLLLENLSNHIFIWEIWNEQNTKRFWIKTPSYIEYSKFVKNISQYIKNKQSKAKFIFGGVFGNDVEPVYSFISENIIAKPKFIHHSINQGVGYHVDYYGFHPYTRECYFSISSGDKIAESIISSIQKTLQYYKNIPLIITEIGVSPILNFRLNGKEIAKIYHKVINFCMEQSIPICIYALSDQSDIHYGALNPDRNFGFLDYHLNEKDLLKEFKKLG